ncbi:uncharacterized protein [Coffea arabica]|uniref:Uncharacterized protein isoform X2 n=1 Tax=Coffea arabica TaxID=13443 RepID=A0ABM4UDM7_COFAR
MDDGLKNAKRLGGKLATRERQLLRGKTCFVDLLLRKAIQMPANALFGQLFIAQEERNKEATFLISAFKVCAGVIVSVFLFSLCFLFFSNLFSSLFFAQLLMDFG